MDRRIRAAVAAGTHSNGPPSVICQSCGKAAAGYLHRTLDGKYFGPCCTPKSELDRIEKLAAECGRWNKAGYSVQFGGRRSS